VEADEGVDRHYPWESGSAQTGIKKMCCKSLAYGEALFHERRGWMLFLANKNPLYSFDRAGF